MHFNVQAGQTYLIRLNGFANDVGAFELTARKKTCPADIAPLTLGDGEVNIDDLLLVISNWNFQCPADIAPLPNGNGTVNIDDLLMVIGTWGPCR